MKKQKKQPIDLMDTIKKLDSTDKKTPKKKNKKNKSNPFILLFVIAIILSVFYTYMSSPSKEKVNTDLGLNDIQMRYASGVYSEISIEGEALLAKKKEQKIEKGMNNKTVTVTEIDKIILPPHDSLKDLGLNDMKNPTKVFVKDDYWGKLMSDAIPSILLMIIFVVLLVFLFGRISG